MSPQRTTSNSIRCPICRSPSVVLQTFTSRSKAAKTRKHRCTRGHRFKSYQGVFVDGDLRLLEDRGHYFPLAR